MYTCYAILSVIHSGHNFNFLYAIFTKYVMDGEDFYILMAVIENIIIGKM